MRRKKSTMFVNTIVMNFAASINIITRLLSCTSTVPYPAIFPIFDTNICISKFPQKKETISDKKM